MLGELWELHSFDQPLQNGGGSRKERLEKVLLSLSHACFFGSTKVFHRTLWYDKIIMGETLCLTSLSDLKHVLREFHIHPQKRLGQHFILSRKAVETIVREVKDANPSIIIEIGAGLGTLACALGTLRRPVVAIEKDTKLVIALQSLVKEWGLKRDIQIVEMDARTIREEDIMTWSRGKSYVVVGNLPYHITSPLIRLFLELKTRPRIIVFTVQKEVALRINARPPSMNLLAVATQFYGTPSVLLLLKPTCFYPLPSVESAIIKIEPHKSLHENPDRFFHVVKLGFSHPRKLLISNLLKQFPKAALIQTFSLSNIPVQARSAELSMEQWINLAKYLR